MDGRARASIPAVMGWFSAPWRINTRSTGSRVVNAGRADQAQRLSVGVVLCVHTS